MSGSNFLDEWVVVSEVLLTRKGWGSIWGYGSLFRVGYGGGGRFIQVFLHEPLLEACARRLAA